MFRVSLLLLCTVGVLLCVLPACDSTCMMLPAFAASLWVGVCRTLYRFAR